MAVAAAGKATWLVTASPDVATAETSGADDVTLGVTVETSWATVWVVVGAGTAGPAEVVLSTEVADGPKVGKFGF